MTNDYATSAGGGFSIRLLGGFQLFDANGRRVRIRSRKARALFAYLAMPVGRPRERDALAALLWPDASRAHARLSVRRAICDVRSCVGEGIQSCGERVFLQAGAFRTDVDEFVRATSTHRVEQLGEAADLYTGEFLARLRVESWPFTEWQLLERQYLRSRLLVCRVCESVAAGGAGGYAHAS